MCQATESSEVVYYTDLSTQTKSKGTEDGKVIKAWKASRNCSIQSLEICTEEAIDNLPVSFIMNNCHILVC